MLNRMLDSSHFKLNKKHNLLKSNQIQTHSIDQSIMFWFIRYVRVRFVINFDEDAVAI